MTEPKHEFAATVHGKDADDVEIRAREVVAAYFGSLEGVVWSIDTDPQVNFAGVVLTYAGSVRAERVTRTPSRLDPRS
jgi:hypothetical protein